jgi:acyl-coenzyme A thioesterase PaaI-like protein
MLDPSITKILRARYGDKIDDFLIPPPVFELMQGDILIFDVEAGTIKTRFPVLAEYQNPYKIMQGGMLAAAVDNTIGPLSFLVAPLNFTRRLEMKYSQPVTEDIDYINVEARLQARQGRKLTFSAEVRDQSGKLLARGQAFHWIVDDEQSPLPPHSNNEADQ